MKRWILTCFAVLSLVLIVAGPAAATPAGNSAASAACENGGYLNYTDAKDNAFKTAGQCTKYAAQGGTLLVKPFISGEYIPFEQSGNFSSPPSSPARAFSPVPRSR